MNDGQVWDLFREVKGGNIYEDKENTSSDRFIEAGQDFPNSHVCHENMLVVLLVVLCKEITFLARDTHFGGLDLR